MVHPVGMLRWLYLGRLMLAFGVFAGAALVWEQTNQTDTLIATLSLLAAIGFNGISLWYTSVLKRPIGTNFLYSQVIFDALLVTAIVHITGGINSSFPPVYILVIAAGALLLPFSGGMLVAALASILYFADLIWFHVPDVANAPTVRLVLWPVPVQLASALAIAMWSTSCCSRPSRWWWARWATVCGGPARRWASSSPSCGSCGWRPMTFSAPLIRDWSPSMTPGA